MHLYDMQKKPDGDDRSHTAKNIMNADPLKHLDRDKNTKTGDGRIIAGSYCFCDCDSYYVVVSEVLDNGAFKIVDLFEQRIRVSYTRNLKLIDDVSKLRIAQQQHKEFLLNHERNS